MLNEPDFGNTLKFSDTCISHGQSDALLFPFTKQNELASDITGQVISIPVALMIVLPEKQLND